MLRDRTLAEFSDETAARTPTPGGGSVAACIAELGSALGLMSARFTEGRKGFEQHEQALAAEISQLEALRGDFADLVEEDAAAFSKVSAAYKLLRDTDEAKTARRAAIQSALIEAMDAPLRTCRAAVSGLVVLDSVSTHVNPNIASDVVVGAYALGAAFRSAWVNVLVNLSDIKDESVKERVHTEGEGLTRQAQELEARIHEVVVGAIGR
jgi:formiminotetrahydrofolate cyclodeaminase